MTKPKTAEPKTAEPEREQPIDEGRPVRLDRPLTGPEARALDAENAKRLVENRKRRFAGR